LSGRKQHSMRNPNCSAGGGARRVWFVRALLLIAVVLAALAAGCATHAADGVKYTNDSLALLDSRVGSGTCDAIEITGHVQNRGRTAVAHVTVDIAILDVHGAQVGSALAAVDDLRPDAVWAFKASSTVGDAAGARITRISDR